MVSLKLFGNSWGNLYIPCVLLITTIRFFCGKWDCLKNFLFHLLRAPIFKNSHGLAKIYFIFSKTHPKSNFKGFKYQIWTSVKRSEKKLSSKTNFITSLQICYSNFRLKLCWRTKIVKQISFEGDWARLKVKCYFQRQSWPKSKRQTFVLAWNSALREKFNFNFGTAFC